MPHLENTPETKFRQLRTDMMISGMGIVALSFWNMIRYILLLISGREEVVERFKNAGLEDAGDITYYLVFLGMAAFIMLLVFFLFSYIGVSAYREGRGKKKGNFHLILAVITVSFSILSGIMSRNHYAVHFGKTDINNVSLILDAFTIFALIEMIYSTIRARYLSRQIENSDTGSGQKDPEVPRRDRDHE